MTHAGDAAHEAPAPANNHFGTLVTISRNAWVGYQTPDPPLFKDNRTIAVRLRTLAAAW